jgi:hypothetical protein
MLKEVEESMVSLRRKILEASLWYHLLAFSGVTVSTKESVLKREEMQLLLLKLNAPCRLRKALTCVKMR